MRLRRDFCNCNYLHIEGPHFGKCRSAQGAAKREYAAIAPKPPDAPVPKTPPDAELLAMMVSSLSRIAELPPSRGYEPALVQNGFHTVTARGISFFVGRIARRLASESKRRRPVFNAIRFLAKPRQKRAILSRAEILLAAWEETSIIETVFDEIGLQETEFIKLLQAIVQGQTTDLNRLAEICATIAPSLSLDRGPKVSAPSAAHKFILESGIKLTKKRFPYARRDRTACMSTRLRRRRVWSLIGPTSIRARRAGVYSVL
jgi:hypothetical protein